ncbi:MAG: alpha family phenol-soluble modulin [Acutalibacteraceae bacterium]
MDQIIAMLQEIDFQAIIAKVVEFLKGILAKFTGGTEEAE